MRCGILATGHRPGPLVPHPRRRRHRPPQAEILVKSESDQAQKVGARLALGADKDEPAPETPEAKAPVLGARLQLYGWFKKGTPNQATAAQRKAALESEQPPLDYLLEVMRDESNPIDVRLEAAKAARTLRPPAVILGQRGRQSRRTAHRADHETSH